ncbi:hypothetical protein PFISCL1PPCAC_22897 [Pristionchus fissidentatus]|uniref:Secreted protein n=1 Tax=Pristionchus fissidentatus TaxID=1538716 RepID=A0AAV5WLY5_9BILA|nr:hypothetical protein PFISCL1PPCAC_22897 [Pristionchus fissidentatus]
MRRLALFLVLAASFSSSDAFMLVLADASYCVHLRCEWRSLGERCKPAAFSRNQNACAGRTFEFVSKDESEVDLLARIKALHPENTFTIVESVELGEGCDRRLLWCNSKWVYPVKDHYSFLKLLRQVPFPGVPPKLQC